jgi:S-(hydroxymethyl)glutathione dehydrogenase/alcohol dehydrogenase
MRAAIFNEVGKEVIDIYDDVEVADPGPGEVRLKLHAAGVCHSDLSAMNGTLPQPAPAVLGHEGAGEIIQVGEGVDQVAVQRLLARRGQLVCGNLLQHRRCGQVLAQR